MQPAPKAAYRSDFRENTNFCPQRDANLGPLAPQASVLPLDHRVVQYLPIRYSVVCAVLDRLLFYVDQGDQASLTHFHGPVIGTAFMDGSAHRIVHRSHDLLNPQQLTLDRVNQHVFFTDPQQNAIFQLDYDGTKRSHVLTALS